MDKNAIKKYAVWARRELIVRVSQKAIQYGITAEDCGEGNAESINGTVLTATEKKQRQALISEIKQKGYEQIMEEVAYTWFNRFSALRFMEVNGYLPSHVRVFTDEDNNFKPQIITEAIHLEMDGLDMEKVYALKDANKTDELYKYLVITQCNALSSILPGMFQKIEDFSELLFPDNLLREGSAIQQMIELIPEEDWKDAVQIIGWLYQYYNSEKKDDVFAALKKNVKITKDNIPAATQLFTPDWIVRYMVENSLGRLWLEGHPNDSLKAEWKYYLDEAEQEADVQIQLDEIRKEYASLKPENIKCIDPCMGSGHILAYMFDVLVQIYEAYGYSSREAVESIVKNNIYGLDIDDRAAQLANFAVMMKARQYDRRFFSRGIYPHVYAIKESNGVNLSASELLGDERIIAEKLINGLHDAKEYGSILNLDVTMGELVRLRKRLEDMDEMSSMGNLLVMMEAGEIIEKLIPLIEIAEAMVQKYDVVVTNPPYMGSSGMGEELQIYTKKYYPNSKLDLFSVFIEKCMVFTANNGYVAMITMQSWMFLTSFDKLRSHMLSFDIVNMAHQGARAFEEISGEVVQTTSFVLRNTNIGDYIGAYERLVMYGSQKEKENNFLLHKLIYTVKKQRYHSLPDDIVLYWISDATVKLFENSLLENYVEIKQGAATSDNNRFLRLWFEVEYSKIGLNLERDMAVLSENKWFPYNKGGTARRWFGNQDYVINYYHNGEEMKAFHEILNKEHPGGRLKNQEYYFRQGFTWSTLSNIFAVRYCPEGMLFDTKGSMGFCSSVDSLWYFMALLNSVVGRYWMHILAPTLDFNPVSLRHMPVRRIESDILKGNVTQCIELAKELWDLNEVSWEYSKPIMLKHKSGISMEDSVNKAFGSIGTIQKEIELKEQENDRIITELYELQPEIADFDDSKNNLSTTFNIQDMVLQFISYAVGCMFGRYSLDVEGLAYAGGEWDANKYRFFPADKDNIIPICDDEYFEDDIVGRFIEFVKVVYGADSLEANLQFIADALGGKGSSREVIRNYFRNDFYKNHCKMYQKRPIYWLFDSGKKGGFKALIYMHRYQQDTIARMRTDYVHEQQARYRTEISDLEARIAGASTSERVKLNKRLATLQAQADEIHGYEEKIHHLADQMIRIDLDDGVKKNYEIFKDVLAKIK